MRAVIATVFVDASRSWTLTRHGAPIANIRMDGSGSRIPRTCTGLTLCEEASCHVQSACKTPYSSPNIPSNPSSMEIVPAVSATKSGWYSR